MDQAQVGEPAEPVPDAETSAAFQSFWEQRYRHFLRMLIYFGAAEADAQDAIGDVIATMWSKNVWATLSCPDAWVRKAVLRTYLARQGRRRKQSEWEFKGRPITTDAYVDHGLNIWEDQEWVTQMLDALPRTQRTIVALVLQELDPKEIAELLDKSPDTVRQNLAHARKRLKASLGEDGRLRAARHPLGRKDIP